MACFFVAQEEVKFIFENSKKIGKSGMLKLDDELIRNEHKHFHPSSNLEPSKADVRLTDRMIKVGDLMGIPLIDHVIVGGDNSKYFSLKCGSAVISFDNQINKDTGLYKLYNTNIHEKIAEQKAREAMENSLAE